MGRRGTVMAPDGSSWRVGRRWLDRRPPALHKWLRLSDDAKDFAWGGAEIADMVGSLWGRLCIGRPWIVEAAPVGAGKGHEERERVTAKVSG